MMDLTQEELISYTQGLHILNCNLVIVKFINMYYGICFKDYTKEVLIGKEQIWFRKWNSKINKLFMYHKDKSLKEFYMPYDINPLAQKQFMHTQVFNDLKSIDNNIKIYRIKKNKWTDITEYQYAISYAIILGITFYSTFYKKDEIILLGKYFDTGYFYNHFRNPNLIGINPFQSSALLKNNKIIMKDLT